MDNCLLQTKGELSINLNVSTFDSLALIKLSYTADKTISTSINGIVEPSYLVNTDNCNTFIAFAIYARGAASFGFNCDNLFVSTPPLFSRSDTFQPATFLSSVGPVGLKLLILDLVLVMVAVINSLALLLLLCQ